MSSYIQMLEDLQSAMLEVMPEKILPSLNNNRPALDRRLNVYIAGYRARLVQSVLSDYPSVVNYLGLTEVERLAINYVESTQSHSYTLDGYPLQFAEYVAKYSNSGFASALARLESAIAKVFWLPDSRAFVPPVDLTAGDLMELRFVQRRASEVIYLEYPVEEYMVAVRREEVLMVGDKKPHFMFIVRHENEVRRYVLEDTEQLILLPLFIGNAVGEVLEEITDKYPERVGEIEGRLQFWFSRWVENGFFGADK